MTLDHGTENTLFAARDLSGDILGDPHLLVRLLAAVGVAEVDHDLWHQSRLLDRGGGDVDALGVVIRPATAAQDDMGILVAGGGEDRRVPVLGQRQEDMRARGGMDRIDGDLDAAIGGILEADRTGQARGQLAVTLALGRARADRAPTDQIGDILRADQIQKLGAGWHALGIEIEEQLARQAQALVDLEAAVEVRIIDQALPAHRGARLLEVDPHHDQQLVADLIANLA